MKLLLALYLCCLVGLVLADRKKYNGYKVLQVTPTDISNYGVVAHLWTLRNQLQIQFWEKPSRVGSSFEILVPPTRLQNVISRLVANGYDYEVINDDVQQYLDGEWKRLDERRQNPATQAFNIDDYNRLEEIHNQLESWVSQCPSAVSCKTEDIGNSYEGRPLKMFQMSTGAGKRKILVDSTTHAREWVSTTTNMKFIFNMITNFSKDNTVTEMLNTYDWYFLPVVNPDGYVFSWDQDRYWRKSRSPNSMDFCPGTDINRNYDSEWMRDGSSNMPCDDTYAGASAASEIETQTMQALYRRMSSDTLVTISIHTAAEMWLHPFGHTDSNRNCARAAEHEQLTEIVNAAADATQERFGESFWQRGSICETIYPASGGSIDYAYKVGLKFSFSPELRGPGFAPDSSVIPLAFQETWDGVVALVRKAASISQ